MVAFTLKKQTVTVPVLSGADKDTIKYLYTVSGAVNYAFGQGYRTFQQGIQNGSGFKFQIYCRGKHCMVSM